jgi:hypothetical protein
MAVKTKMNKKMLWWMAAVFLLVVVSLFIIHFFKLYEGAKPKGNCVSKLNKINPHDCTKDFCQKGKKPRFICDHTIDFPLYKSIRGMCPPPLISDHDGYCVKKEENVEQPDNDFPEYCEKNFGNFECDLTKNLYKADNNGNCPRPKNDQTGVYALSSGDDNYCRNVTWQPENPCTRNYRAYTAGGEKRDYRCNDGRYSHESGQCPDGFGLLNKDDDACTKMGETESRKKNVEAGALNYKNSEEYQLLLAEERKTAAKMQNITVKFMRGEPLTKAEKLLVKQADEALSAAGKKKSALAAREEEKKQNK